MINLHGHEIFGIGIDDETRCEHWKSELDIVAIRFKCCGRWYSCFDCHGALSAHTPQVWPEAEFAAEAILCGSCGHRQSIGDYLKGVPSCPACGKGFNPGCARHRDLYFET